MSDIRKCDNCGATIGNLEGRFEYQGSVVCAPCHVRLTSRSVPAQRVPTVPDPESRSSSTRSALHESPAPPTERAAQMKEAAMDDVNARRVETPRMGVANTIARAVVLYGTPIALALLGIYLVESAWQRGFYAGVRSLAGALLPIVVASLLYVFSRSTLTRLASVPTAVGVMIGAALGIAVMGVLRVTARESAIPIAELMVFGCFAVLVFSTAAERGDKSLSYYYGVMCGLLLYVILFGFPAL